MFVTPPFFDVMSGDRKHIVLRLAAWSRVRRNTPAPKDGLDRRPLQSKNRLTRSHPSPTGGIGLTTPWLKHGSASYSGLWALRSSSPGDHHNRTLLRPWGQTRARSGSGADMMPCPASGWTSLVLAFSAT